MNVALLYKVTFKNLYDNYRRIDNFNWKKRINFANYSPKK